MAYDYQHSFESLKHKAEMLVNKYRSVVSQRDEALAEVKQLRDQLQSQEKELALLKVKLEDLTVVTTAFPSREAVSKGREVLSRLVREIDQCITDLTN